MWTESFVPVSLGDLMRSGRRLVVYVTLGDDVVDHSLFSILKENGCDVVELGLPTNLAKYDGPAIKRSMARALKRGSSAKELLASLPSIPFDHKVLFMYYELAKVLGLEEVFNTASGNVCSILFPDLLIDYPEGQDHYLEMCERYGMEPTFFVTSSFPHRLIKKLASLDPAFIYMGLMLSTGVSLPIFAERNIRIVKQIVGKVPLVVGFAINSSDQVERYVKAGADGIVVGSALLRLLEESKSREGLARVSELVRSLKEALVGHERAA